MKATAKAKLRARGRRMMAEAKRIRAKSPGKKWTTCVKEAAKKMKK